MRRAVPLARPEPFKGDFSGLVLDDNRLHLRAVKHFEAWRHHLTVISNVPITPELLRTGSRSWAWSPCFRQTEEPRTPVKLAADVREAGGCSCWCEVQKPAPTPGAQLSHTSTSGDTGGHGQPARQDTGSPQSVEAGHVPPAANSFDFALPFRHPVHTRSIGTREIAAPARCWCDTRPSMLYATLFSALGENAGIFLDGADRHRHFLRHHRADRAVHRRAPHPQR